MSIERETFGKHLVCQAGVAQWTERQPANHRIAGWFPGRAHAWVEGQVPSRGQVRGNHTLMFLSLSFPLLEKLSNVKYGLITEKYLMYLI